MAVLLHTAVCEDDARDREHLLALIARGGAGEARGTVLCDSFEDGGALLAGFFSGKYDLIFLDIFMKGQKGVDIARAIRETDADVVLCFTTSSPDYTRESYRLGALKYIEKPVREEDVAHALRLAELVRRDRQSLTLLIGGEYVSLALDSILFFETRDHAVHVHTTSGILRASQSIRIEDVEGMLPPTGQFLRCHRSFIVNLRHVVRIDRDFIMKNGERAYIRGGDEKKCADILKSYLLDRLGRDGL